MVIFDFLIYNLSNWLTKHRSIFNRSMILGRAIFGASLTIALLLFDLWIIISTILLINITVYNSVIPITVLATIMMALLNYMYVKKNRLERIIQSPDKPFNASDNMGQILSLCLVFLPFFILFVLMIMF